MTQHNDTSCWVSLMFRVAKVLALLNIKLGNCDIDFWNFRHCQVQNFKILNLYLESSFESTKSETESQQCTSKLHESLVFYHWNFMKFHEMLLVLWNLVNYFKISQFLVKFRKILKDLRKILLKWLGKTVKYCLNFVNFHSCTGNGLKVGQLLSIT